VGRGRAGSVRVPKSAAERFEQSASSPPAAGEESEGGGSAEEGRPVRPVPGVESLMNCRVSAKRVIECHLGRLVVASRGKVEVHRTAAPCGGVALHSEWRAQAARARY